MNAEPATLTRVGAWGQIATIVLAVLCWALGSPEGLLASCVAYFVLTMVGLTGLSRAESGIVGAIMYPFVLPGLLPLYHFATR